MNSSITPQIVASEESLRQAMLHSDVVALDALLAPDLMFTNHLGQVMSKRDDLEAHKSGILNISRITLSDQRLTIHDNVVIVSVQAQIAGKYNGKESDSTFRFTRVWRQSSNNTWQVIAGHSSIVV